MHKVHLKNARDEPVFPAVDAPFQRHERRSPPFFSQLHLDEVFAPYGQVYDALSYFYDHSDEIEEMLDVHTIDVWQERLKERLGEAAYLRLAGEAADA
jgi:hypothetical protein